MIPLLIASITATTMAFMLRGFDPILAVTLQPQDAFELWQIPLFILLGVCCGLMSWYFTSTNLRVGNFFRKIDSQYKKWLVGGAVLGILIFIFPPLYGEGYDTIELLLNGTSNAEWDTVMNHSFFYGHGNLLLVYLMLIILFKVFASSATNGGGGCGGIFAPSLYLGLYCRLCFLALQQRVRRNGLPAEKNFALMGMAGVMSGVMHAPLTGVFLIAELTGGYDLFLPLMIVSVSSYLHHHCLRAPQYLLHASGQKWRTADSP